MSNTALMTLTANNAELTEQEALILAEIQDDAHALDLQPARVKIAPGGIGKFLLGQVEVLTDANVVQVRIRR